MNLAASAALVMILGFPIAGICGAAPPLTGAQETKVQARATLAVKGVPYYLDTEIATGIRGDENLALGIYIFHLKCASDLTCQLDLISLNECDKNDKNGGSHFSPSAFSWDTSSGLLEVKQLSDSLVELVAYQAFGKKLPAKILLTYDAKAAPFKQLTDFNGIDFVNRRFWPDIAKRVEYVPVPIGRTKKLDCPAFLPGIKAAN